ncbi:MAG TPA: DUF58 domain-containing protein [Actinocrinis sp.]|nr:DUF58 domain-containing protein [Actinocrinis sp.]HEV2344278.1 DUF58 domain-containing protein [Actinocrinis sp.]
MRSPTPRNGRGSIVLTGRTGAVAAAGSVLVGVVAGVFHVPGWAGIAAFEAALGFGVAADAIRAGTLRDLAFERSGSTTVRLGESAAVHLTVTNNGAHPLRGILRDAWTPSAGNVPQTTAPRQVSEVPKEPRHALSIEPNAAQRIDTILTPTRRGDRIPDRVTVRSLGPLGLAGRQLSSEIPWRLRVLPPFESRKHLPSRLARLHETDGRTPVLVRGQGSEFDSLREYVIGDDVRSIDWRATARRNDVVVRTWRPERDRHVVMVLDTSRTSAGRVGDVPRLDSAIDAALLLTALATRAGDRVDLLAYDQQLRASVPGALPGRTLPLFSDAMAGLEPSLIELNAEGLVTHLMKQIRRPSLVVLLTSIDAATIDQGLLPQVGRLTGRHNVIVASVADPRIAQLSSARGDADAVFAAASAELALATRRQAAAELRRHGVHVVDAIPDRFAPALADTYLALKAAGRL